MNMLLRYLILSLLLKYDNTRPQHFHNPISRDYRILPHDMGFRDHIPNYRYLSFIELNIQKWFMQQNTIQGAKWIISAQEMTYLKQGKLFDKLTINSQIIGWDSKYFYFRHEFLVKNTLIAVAMTKFVLVDAGKTLPTTIITDKPEQLHPAITSWQAHQQTLKQLEKIVN